VDLHALPDGRIVTIRPIQADDIDRLRTSHDRLSQESRYRRFMSAKPHLSVADAHYLVDIDGRDHYALVAIAAEPEGEAIAGVARFVRLPADVRKAEFAIVIGDAWQGQGLGVELLGRLADAAVTRGVERFQGTILADNLAILRLAQRVADGPVERRRLGNTLEIEFDLPTRRDDGPSAPAMIAAWAGS
jgi:RimJ/RimL family protein N-acetyltransferase